jgi:hypothetical protein
VYWWASVIPVLRRWRQKEPEREKGKKKGRKGGREGRERQREEGKGRKGKRKKFHMLVSFLPLEAASPSTRGYLMAPQEEAIKHLEIFLYLVH